MADRSDKTHSPSPNELANLYRLESEAEDALHILGNDWKMWKRQLQQIRAAIKRACGDRETI